MITVVVILSVLVVVLGFTTFNLLRKNEKAEDLVIRYEQHIQNLDEVIQFIVKRVDEIDQKGSFKSDDEVGFFFQRLKMLNELLRNFKI
jgi:hypothetical protein